MGTEEKKECSSRGSSGAAMGTSLSLKLKL